MRLARVTKIPVGLAVLLLAASCGGGGVTREDFAAEANPICARVNSAVADLGEPQSAEEFVSFAGEALPLIRDGLDDLRAVEAPEEDQDAFDEFIDTSQQMTDKTEEASAAAQAGDQAALQAAIAEIDQLNTDSIGMAADLDLDDCAQ